LSDAGSATIKRYGILATIGEEALDKGLDDPVLAADVRLHVTQNPPTDRVRGLPYPGTFILDQQGRVKSRFFEDFYVERSTVSSMMLRLSAGLPSVAGTQISTEHLSLTTYPSDSAISVGNRIALALQVTPRPRMHVYAPGAKDYRVISLTLAPQPVIRTLPMQYPQSEIYHFKPLDERVPVYQKPFTLVQEVILEGNPQAQAALKGQESLTIHGTFEYQACDDKLCFNPVSLPLSWTLALKPLDTERPIPRP
jgi:hypothetical protein